MGVMRHRRPPSVENRRDPNLGTEMFWISGNFDHRVSARAHQQIVECTFVLIGDISDRFWQSENEMEIPHGQKFSLSFFQPRLCSACLTFWAVAIATRVVGNMLMGTIRTARDVATKDGCPATLDRAHDLQLIKTYVTAIGFAKRITMIAENIGNLQRWAGQGGL